MCRFDNENYWTFIGGKAKFSETTEEAIIRELKEETKALFEIDHLVSVIENFFYMNNQKWHQYIFFYLLKDDQNELPIFTARKVIEDECDVVYQWFSLDELDEINLKPICGTKILKNMNSKSIIHIINKDCIF